MSEGRGFICRAKLFPLALCERENLLEVSLMRSSLVARRGRTARRGGALGHMLWHQPGGNETMTSSANRYAASSSFDLQHFQVHYSTRSRNPFSSSARFDITNDLFAHHSRGRCATGRCLDVITTRGTYIDKSNFLLHLQASSGPTEWPERLLRSSSFSTSPLLPVRFREEGSI